MSDIPKRRTFLNITPEIGDAMRHEAMSLHAARWAACHTNGTKICNKCSTEKDKRTAFRKDTGYKDGHENICIPCRNLNSKENKQKRKANARKMEAR